MVELQTEAPDFTAPLANGDISTFTLSENLDEAPIILAFFPGAFTNACTIEMETFEEELQTFEKFNSTVYGISVDSPFSLNEFRQQHELSFDLISDMEKEIIEDYDVVTGFPDLGIEGVAQRAIFIVDETQTITYKWVADDPSQEPNYVEVFAEIGESPEQISSLETEN